MPLIPCPTEAKTPENLVDVLRRFLPQEYLQPMEPPRVGAPGAPGWETILAASQTMSRVSVAAERLGCGLFFLTAPSGVVSTATVRLTRSSTTVAVADADAVVDAELDGDGCLHGQGGLHHRRHAWATVRRRPGHGLRRRPDG